MNSRIDITEAAKGCIELFKSVHHEMQTRENLSAILNSCEYNKKLQPLVPCKSKGDKIGYVAITKITDPVYDKWLEGNLPDILYGIICKDAECTKLLKSKDIKQCWAIFYNEIFNILNFGNISYRNESDVQINDLKKIIIKLKRKAKTIKNLEHKMYRAIDVDRVMDKTIGVDTPYYSLVIATPTGKPVPNTEGNALPEEIFTKPIVLDKNMVPIVNIKLWNYALELEALTGHAIPVRMLIPKYENAKYAVYNNVYEGKILVSNIKAKEFGNRRLAHHKTLSREEVNNLRLEAIDLNNEAIQRYRNCKELTMVSYVKLRTLFQSNKVTINSVHRNIAKVINENNPITGAYTSKTSHIVNPSEHYTVTTEPLAEEVVVKTKYERRTITLKSLEKSKKKTKKMVSKS